VDKLIWQLEYDLADWLVKPGGDVEDVWNTPVSEIFQGSGQAEGQGRLVLVTQEQKFLSNNKLFFKKPSDTFTTGGKKDELFEAISNFQGTPKIFKFDALLNPSISDFISTLKNGIEKFFDFIESFITKLPVELPANTLLAIPGEVLNLVKGILDMIIETITGFFDIDPICWFKIFPLEDIVEFITDAVLEIFDPLIGPIKDAIDEVKNVVDDLGIVRSKRGISKDTERGLYNFVQELVCSNSSISKTKNKNDLSRMSCPSSRSLNFGQCEDSIFDLFPSPLRLASPIFEMWLIPFNEFNKLLEKTAEPFQDTIKPACKAVIQYWVDVQFEKLLDYEFGNLPGLAAVPITKFKIRTFYERFLNILDFYSNSLPGVKKFADDVNQKVAELWRENEQNLEDVSVTMHAYISGSSMVEDNIERLRKKLEKFTKSTTTTTPTSTEATSKTST